MHLSWEFLTSDELALGYSCVPDTAPVARRVCLISGRGPICVVANEVCAPEMG